MPAFAGFRLTLFVCEADYMVLRHLWWLGVHAAIGVAVAYVPVLGKVYAWSLILTVFLLVVFAKDWKVLVFSVGYVTAAEVFTRMSRGLFFYESHKYLAMLLFLGIIIRTGIRWKSIPYLVYILLLVPGVMYTWWSEAQDPSYIHIHLRKDILFNIAGPLALGIGAMALTGIKMNLDDYKRLFFMMLLPIVSTTFYIIVKTPDLRDIVFGTTANFATSGGFGPNQVATILGLGIFVSAVLFFLVKNPLERTVYFLLLILITYRGFLTFSRGGIITGIIMVFVFLVACWLSEYKFFSNYSFRSIIIPTIVIGIVYYLAMEITGGMIYNRYAGLNMAGQKKEDISSGRIELFLVEINDFIKHPFLGTGVGRAKIQRTEDFGVAMASHNEISRLLAEHGMFGLFALFLLLLIPVMQGYVHKNNLFFYPFYAFWILTIFHSAMRLAAPAVMYALSLIYLTYDKDRVHW